MAYDEDGSDQIAEDRVRVQGHALNLVLVARIFEVIVILGAIGGIIAGIAVAVQSNTDAQGATTHPDVGTGIGIILGTVVAALLYWAVVRVVRLFGEYVELRLRGDEQVESILFYARTSRTQECPMCMEDAWEGAKVCPSCGHPFEPSAPTKN